MSVTVTSPGCLRRRGAGVDEPLQYRFAQARWQLNERLVRFDGAVAALEKRRRPHMATKKKHRRTAGEVASLPTEVSAQRWDGYSLGPLRERHPLAHFADRWQFEEPLYREIARSVPSGGKVLEVGSGSGVNLILLAARAFK